jgi:tRNA:m4X modification enzyme
MKANPYFQRYKCDISDFDVQKLAQTMAQTAILSNSKLNLNKEVSELNELNVVGVCKHMCGQALDISLRALLKTKMSGCILASCCHHLCDYENYLNNQFF